MKYLTLGLTNNKHTIKVNTWLLKYACPVLIKMNMLSLLEEHGVQREKQMFNSLYY
jgi:hypothetical protein